VILGHETLSRRGEKLGGKNALSGKYMEGSWGTVLSPPNALNKWVWYFRRGVRRGEGRDE